MTYTQVYYNEMIRIYMINLFIALLTHYEVKVMLPYFLTA